ncbi:N6-adenosine-methyltransferase non-catalytic subunit MTB [Salvia hispanica]|uniref:N6-adenosine-methyltransferase non-catalytic subunit MTB n=1 Tax=Salvia hispanica TaxID=49212 RepID=UPI002009B6C7|nr:N6-adenosine-methyltransferase non-catalytic subunit MTB [Salvia hispanica]XP_047970458.1 N6-adenosine-methyltransferase non-catalytic subunit MTB [Salvia hispanica]
MGSPERVRSSKKREIEEDIEVNIDIVRDDDEWVGDEKRRQRLSKSRQQGSGDDVDGLDGSGKRRSTSERHESRKRVGSSSRGDSDQDDYGSRRESRSKQLKKKQEESTLDVLSSWYEDNDAENKLDGGEKPGGGGHSRTEESDRKKSSSKYPEQDTDMEKVPDRDMVKKDVGREKPHGVAEHGRSHRRRWDEPDDTGRAYDYGDKSDARSCKPSDVKLDSANERERSDPLQIESNDIQSKGSEPVNEKGIRSNDREERRVDSERKTRGRSEFPEEDNRGSLARDDASNKERSQEHRQQRNPTRDVADSYGRSSNAEEDAGAWGRDKSRRDVDNSTSRVPEKSGRRQFDTDNSEMDYERSTPARRKDSGKDGSYDDRSKGRDDSWSERSWDRENAKDAWKRKHDKEARDNDPAPDGIRDWELPRRGRDRVDGRSGGRKDGSRTEAVKTSSKYGISNENYDVIEIQTKPFDYGREDSRSRNSDLIQEGEEFAYSREERSRSVQGSAQSGEDTKDRVLDGDLAMQDQNSWRDDNDFQGEKSRGQKPIASNRGAGAQSSSGGSLALPGGQDPGSYGRSPSQGNRGNRMGRPGRGRPSGRDNQQGGIPVPLSGSTFGPLGLPPPGHMQSLPPNMSPAPGPISPGVFIPPFQAPMLWPGARGVDMNMLAVPPGLPPVPPSPLGPRFSPNLGNAPNAAMMFNPSGPGRGMLPSMSGPNFNAMSPAGRGQPQDKASGGWNPPRINAPPGKAPSRGEQNDYSQNFVDTGMRPQNFIRELELTSVVEDYPKLRELIQKKDEIVSKSASAPMYYKCDLREQVLSSEFFGTKFDVILVDPPWEEYVHRAPGVTDHTDHWTFEEIMNLKIEAIADTPSFIFLWVGDGVGLEQGRQCLKKWGFRRCEDICWVKTNKTNATPGLRHDSHTLFQRSKEHCLMGIKGTVRRSTDGHIIHANIDTDVIIAEEPPYGSTAKPEDMYRIIEHFALGRRRLELFGEDHNIRSGWLTVGTGLSSSNFNSEAYVRNFGDKDGKVWVGGGGRNPPPEAPHLVLTTPEIESLRPKSPMKNQQQSASISLTTANSSSKRPTGTSPQNHQAPNLNQEGSSSNLPSPAPWASPLEAFKGREGGGHLPSDERMFDMYGYNAPFGPPAGDFIDYESHRGMNML